MKVFCFTCRNAAMLCGRAGSMLVCGDSWQSMKQKTVNTVDSEEDEDVKQDIQRTGGT